MGRHVGVGKAACGGYSWMHRPCCGAVAILCALAIAPVALAQQSAPGADTTPQSAWPKILPQSKPGEVPETASPAWSATEIDEARARCAGLLKGLDVVAIPHAPIREGAECGAPAPVQLVSIGSNPQIAFTPPPLLTCEMVAAMHRWLQRDVQPLARKHLGTPIVGVTTMSSFSCRTAYGRAKSRLSEHGRVNAIDIAGFVTAQGQTAAVLTDWGPIAREIVAGATTDAGRKQAAPVAKQDAEAKGPPRAPARAVQPAGIAFEFPGITVGEPPLGVTTGLGWAPPNRVGGPQPTAAAAPEGAGRQFLRAVHRAACNVFATVLGPEANKAHKNHFHLDMAVRTSANICE